MKSRTLDFDEVRQKAKGKWLRILGNLARELHPAIEAYRSGRLVPCPLTGEGKTRFRLFRDAPETGGGIHNHMEPEALTDGIKMLMWLRRWSVKEAYYEVANELGMDIPDDGFRSSVAPSDREAFIMRQPAIQLERKPDPVEHAKRLNATWGASLSLRHPGAEIGRRYLASRGITTSSQYVRFSPSLRYVEKDNDGRYRHLGDFPALIAKFYHADGTPVALHRIYLTKDGKKVPFDNPKKTTAMPEGWTISGSAVRLDSPGPVLCTGEGMETAWSVRQTYGLPTWACTTAGILESLIYPKGVELVLIFADRDRNGRGERAAAVAKRNAWEQGVKSQILLPPFAIPDDEPKGVDWNLVLTRAGRAGFPDLSHLYKRECAA